MDATVNLSLTHSSPGQKNLVKLPGLIMVALEPPPTSLFSLKIETLKKKL